MIGKKKLINNLWQNQQKTLENSLFILFFFKIV